MNIKETTDLRYVPIKDLSNFGNDFVNKTKEYRRTFMEVIQLDDLSFVNIVETPKLLKQRYMKNIDIKNIVSFEASENDFILQIAKDLILKKQKVKLDSTVKENLIKRFEENGRDITIITSYLVENIDKFIKVEDETELRHDYPELTKSQIMFVNKYQDPSKGYVLKDYQELTGTSYETARKSLDKLAELKFYKKEKFGRKFVFKAIRKGGE